MQEKFPGRREKRYPGWVQAACTLMCLVPLLCPPAVALIQLLARRRRQRGHHHQDQDGRAS